jgi:uncharacterized protein (DUF4415 family)
MKFERNPSNPRAKSAKHKKKHISLRLDSDVYEFFKRDGRGYQTRINAVLRLYLKKQIKNQTTD